MIRALRKAIAHWRLINARWDMAYWRSAIDTAHDGYERACERVALLEQAPNTIDFPLPSVLRGRNGARQ